MKNLIITIGVLLLLGNELQSQTSGILSQNLVISKANSPYVLTGDLQIPENLSITINEGGEINGNNFQIRTKGDFIVNGTKQNPVKINNITLNAIGTNGDLGYSIIDINYSIIRRSKILTPTGDSDKPKIFKLKNLFIVSELKKNQELILLSNS